MPGVGLCCSHGNQGKVRQTVSHEERHGKVTVDCMGGCSPGGALREFQDAGEELGKLRADAGLRGCCDGTLRELQAGGDRSDWNCGGDGDWEDWRTDGEGRGTAGEGS